MLCLTIKVSESVFIGDDIKIKALETKGSQVRIGIDAPAEINIVREDIAHKPAVRTTPRREYIPPPVVIRKKSD